MVKQKARRDLFAIDFGTGAALQIWGPDGSINKRELKLPRVKGGKTPRDEFLIPLEVLLSRGDVVVESPTIGSSGATVEDVLAVVQRSTNTLYTISARAVKNHRADFDLPWRKGQRYAKDGSTPPKVEIELFEQPDVHVEDAEIIYKIATEFPWRLRVWHIAEPLQRKFTSVRPADKLGYRDPHSNQLMKLLPPFIELPDDIKEVVGVKSDYSRALVMPFAQALKEPYLLKALPEERRNRFQKIIGLYDHGYPSHYRRMSVEWMHENMRMIAGVTSVKGVPRDIRKQAWKVTQRQMRHLFHLASARV